MNGEKMQGGVFGYQGGPSPNRNDVQVASQARALSQAGASIQRDTVSSKLGEMADAIERLWKAAQFAGMHADAVAGPEPQEAAAQLPSPAPQGLVEALAFKVGDLTRIASVLEYHQSRVARALS